MVSSTLEMTRSRMTMDRKIEVDSRPLPPGGKFERFRVCSDVLESGDLDAIRMGARVIATEYQIQDFKMRDQVRVWVKDQDQPILARVEMVSISGSWAILANYNPYKTFQIWVAGVERAQRLWIEHS